MERRIGRYGGLVLCASAFWLSPAVAAPASTAQSCAAEAQTQTAVPGGNPTPAILPSLQAWRGGIGRTTLTAKSRILFDDPKLSPVADKLARDIGETSGLRLRIVQGTAVSPTDILLSLSPCVPVEAIGDEGGSFYAGRHVALRGATPNGVFFATRTLLQLLTLDGQPAGRHRQIVQGYSVDRPAYRERSLMLDVARKFAPKEFLIRYLRFLGWYKFNTLHLHLNDFATDANGKVIASFRLKSDNPAFRGPVSDDGQYYTRQDWAELEAEAAANGITIVPEFDTPGHSQAFTRARPDLASSKGFLDPTKPETLAYVRSVFAEFLPWFKSDRVHIGGDEVEDFSPQQIVPYLNGLASFLKAKGKTVQLWGDYNYLTMYNPKLTVDLDKSIWIQRWVNWEPEQSVNYTLSGYRWTDSYGGWYVVPRGPDYFNPNGLSGAVVYDKWFGMPQTALSPFLPIGGQLSLWNDRAETKSYDYETDVHKLLRDAIPAAGQIYWSGQLREAGGQLIPYSTVGANVERLGFGPGASGLSGALSSPKAAAGTAN